jgi:hypothetical protein
MTNIKKELRVSSRKLRLKKGNTKVHEENEDSRRKK